MLAKKNNQCRFRGENEKGERKTEENFIKKTWKNLNVSFWVKIPPVTSGGASK